MISIDSLLVKFGGVVALDELTVELSGEVCGLIGPNGAGKTTLLNVLSGFVPPTSGTVMVDGTDQGKLSPAQRARNGLRRTYQTELVVSELTLWDNVLITAENTSSHAPGADVERVLALVGLDARRDQRAADLDTFDRRLVEIARAVVGQPNHVLMDEPGGGLGVAETAQLRDLIKRLPSECGTQVVLVDHDVDLIAATCDMTACLDFGELIAWGPTTDVLESDAVRQAYLGSTDGDVS